VEATQAVRSPDRVRPLGAVTGRIAVGAASGVLAAVVARLAIGAGQVNYDSLYALVWGRSLAHGQAPDYGAGVVPPTPHPLSTVAGALLAPFGADADTALRVVAFLALGALGVLAFAVGRRWLGTACGAVAALLVLTRDATLFYGGLAYFDLVFVVLVLGALAVETRRPRAGAPVLVLLGLAGLWRPEAWVLAGAYGLYLALAPGAGSPGRRAAWLAAAAAAPVAWLLFDLVLTGDPLYSLAYTQDAATDLGRATGPGAVVTDLPRTLGQVVRPAAALGALAGAGLLLAYRRRDALLPLGALVASLGGTALAVAAGTPLNPRYLLLPATLCVLLCAAALTGWTQVRPGTTARRVWQAAAAVVALALVATAPGQLTRIRDVRDRLAFQAAVAEDAETMARGVRCGPPVLAAGRPVPQIALATNRPAGAIRVARGTAPADTPYLAPAGPREAREYLLVDRVPRPPAGPPVASSAHWRLYGRCPAGAG
jgi:hypothetical protein